MNSTQNFHKSIFLLKLVEYKEISIINVFCINLLKIRVFLIFILLQLLKSSIHLTAIKYSRKIICFVLSVILLNEL